MEITYYHKGAAVTVKALNEFRKEEEFKIIFSIISGKRSRLVTATTLDDKLQYFYKTTTLTIEHEGKYCQKDLDKLLADIALDKKSVMVRFVNHDNKVFNGTLRELLKHQEKPKATQRPIEPFCDPTRPKMTIAQALEHASTF